MFRPTACLAILLALFLTPSPTAADLHAEPPEGAACTEASCLAAEAPPLLPVVTVDGPLDSLGVEPGMLTGEDNPCPSAHRYPLGIIFQYPHYKGRWTTFCAARPCVWQEDGLRNKANYGVSWLASVPFDHDGRTWDDRVSSMYSTESTCIIKLNEHPKYEGRGIACWNGGCEDVGDIDNLGSSLRFEYNP
jgi:hypothetical protein